MADSFISGRQIADKLLVARGELPNEQRRTDVYHLLADWIDDGKLDRARVRVVGGGFKDVGNATLRDELLYPDPDRPFRSSRRIYGLGYVLFDAATAQTFLAQYSGDAKDFFKTANTITAEGRCTNWLAELMRESEKPSRTKSKYLDEAQDKFPGLPERAFNRAWANAVSETSREKWSASGRRSGSKTTNPLHR